MNAPNVFNVEYFRNRFANHDATIKELIESRVIPKTSSRKKRDYVEAFLSRPYESNPMKNHQ